jgi:hypothetical protein
MTEASEPAAADDVEHDKPHLENDETFTHPGPPVPWVGEDGCLRVPWLVVYGPGPSSEDVAVAIVEQCVEHNVTAVLRSLDEYGATGTLGFQSLILVLPSVAGSSQDAKCREFLKIAEDYRKRTKSAAEALVPQSDRWQQLGSIQLLLTNDALTSPATLDLIEIACSTHFFSIGEQLSVDLFAIFGPGAAQAKRTSQVSASRRAHWRHLEQWGITTPVNACAIKDAIDVHRDALDRNVGKRAMNRPVNDVDLNRLDLVLFEPNIKATIPPGSTDEERERLEIRFRDNGARIVRDVLNDLEARFDFFARPESMAGRKNAQAHFAELYTRLQVVTS